VLDKKLSSHQEELGKKIGSYEEGLKTLRSEIAAIKDSGGSQPSGKEKPGSATEPPELIELRKRVKELEDANSKAIRRAEEADKKEQDYRFNTLVKDSLIRHDCEKPDVVLAAIAPKLKFDAETGNITGTLSDDYGTRDVGLDEYIKSHVSTEVVPQLFRGKMRPGSAAGGDDGLEGGQFQFTMEQLKDSEFYEKHAPEIRAALEKKQVKLDHPKN
jgi:hypothetical protein